MWIVEELIFLYTLKELHHGNILCELRSRKSLMRIQAWLIANGGEVAVRIARAAAELGIRTVAVFSEDDVQSLHIRKVDEAHPLRRKGAAAYLDVEQLLAVARAANCDAVHPGYGFLSENAHFARRCTEEGLRFVGPQADVLELFGDKVNTRTLAERQDVLVIPGTSQPPAWRRQRRSWTL